MYVKEKLVEMLLLQDETNRKVFPDWRYRLAATDFRVAFLVEAGELADHLGYKWWSQKEPDLDQARMEAVDMWHFLMSEWMLSGFGLDQLLVVTQPLPTSAPTTQRALARTHVSTLLTQGGNLMTVMSRFGLLCANLGITFDWLYKHYVGKAALNRFRWANSYGSGYQKIWNGREDNEHLTEILATLDDEQVGLETITTLLQERYAERG